MKERIGYLFRIFLFLIISFAIQKPLFMLYNREAAAVSGIGLADGLDVIVHGLQLDAATATYFIVYPFILVLLSFFCHIHLRKWTTPYYICVALAISIIFIADTVIYTFWGFKLNSSALLYADNPTAVTNSISGIFVAACVCAIMFTAFLYVVVLRKLTPNRFHPFTRHKAWASIMIPTGLLMFLCIRGGTEESTSNVSDAYYSDNEFLNHSAINPIFNTLYSLSKSKDFAHEFHFFTEEEKRRLTDGIFTTESIGDESILNRQRPNILLIIWEGCAGHFVELTGGDKHITPCLNAIARESVVFTNCHAGSFRTDRGTVCILNGWLGFPTASIMKTPEKSRTLPSLALSLGKEGYRTDFWYGGDIGFTNMKSYLYESGYEKIYSDRDFPAEDRNYSKWGVPDHIVLDSLAADISRRKDNEQWFTTVLTLSSHEPWDVPFQKMKDKKKNSFAYTDHCVGRLLDKLKETKAWENLLVIIIPDHGIKEYDGQSGSDYRIAHIPMVWTGGAIAGRRTIDTLMGQSDMTATLLGQLHIPHDKFLFSRDIFSSTYKYPSALHTFDNGMTFMDSTGVSTFDNHIQKTVFTSNHCDMRNNDSDFHCNDSIRVRRAQAILQLLYEDMAGR